MRSSTDPAISETTQTNDQQGVTVVVACYNHAKFLEQALTSAFSQDYEPLSVIITDDASVDNSQELISSLLVERGWKAQTIFHRTNKGICATFNEALAEVRTPYVSFISADDWQLPTRMSRLIPYLQQDPRAGMVYSSMDLIAEDGAPLGLNWASLFGDTEWPGNQRLRDPFYALVEGNWIPAPSVVSRTACLREAGGFDESLPFEDYDMWLRLAHFSNFAYCPESLVMYRKTSGSLSEAIGGDSLRIDLRLRILSKHLGVRRDIDDYLLPRLYIWALQSSKNGLFTDEARRIIISEAWRNPTPRKLVHAIIATARRRI